MYFSPDRQNLTPEAIQLYAEAMLRNQVNRLPQELLLFVEENTDARILVIRRYRELKAIQKHKFGYRYVVAASFVLLACLLSYQTILLKPVQRWLWSDQFTEYRPLEESVQETNLILRQHDPSGLMNLGAGTDTEMTAPKQIVNQPKSIAPAEMTDEVSVLWIPGNLSQTAQLRILNNKAALVAEVTLQDENGKIQLSKQPDLSPGLYYAEIQTKVDSYLFRFDFYKRPI